MLFHQTDNIERPGSPAEAVVWRALKLAFKDNPGQAFWRFPIFSNTGQRRKEPDILILDNEFGILVIEVKGYVIGNIAAIQGHRWVLQGGPQDSSNPYQQAEDAGWALKNRAGSRLRMFRDRCPPPVKAIVALPHITRQEWQQRNFPGVANPESHLLFADEFAPADMMARIRAIPFLNTGTALTSEAFGHLQTVIAGMPEQTGDPCTENPRPVESRVEALARSAAYLQEADTKQIQIASEIPPGFQQVRGIAGSGKTILLCHKAAAMHLKRPQWDIALVFFTRSLYEQVRGHLDRALKYQSQGEVGLLQAESHIHVLHAWGAADRPGFYRKICQASGGNPLGVNDVPEGYRRPPSKGLAHVCKRLFQEADDIEPLYDAVLIDEAQDLIAGPETQHKGKEPFFWLAYRALRPVEGDDTGRERRLIWAYDEAQSLDNLLIPTAKEILGEEFNRATSGSHKGNISRSHVMKKCYRTPGPVLAAASAMGMGLLRNEGPVSLITRQEDWDKVGWEVSEGQLLPGNRVTIRRPSENSPNPIPRFSLIPTLSHQWHEDRPSEYVWLARMLAQDIQEGIRPERIMVVIPNDYAANRPHNFARLAQMATAVHQAGISCYKAGAAAPGVFWEQHAVLPDRFFVEGCVTFSLPVRAKGNEVDVVYLMALDLLKPLDSTVGARNQIFTSMTRTKGWCKVSGVQPMGPLGDELQQCIEIANSGETPSFTFDFRRPQRVIDDGEMVQGELVLNEKPDLAEPLARQIKEGTDAAPPLDPEQLWVLRQRNQIYEKMRTMNRSDLEDNSVKALAQYMDIQPSVLMQALRPYGFEYSYSIHLTIPESVWDKIQRV